MGPIREYEVLDVRIHADVYNPMISHEDEVR